MSSNIWQTFLKEHSSQRKTFFYRVTRVIEMQDKAVNLKQKLTGCTRKMNLAFYVYQLFSSFQITFSQSHYFEKIIKVSVVCIICQVVLCPSKNYYSEFKMSLLKHLMNTHHHSLILYSLQFWKHFAPGNHVIYVQPKPCFSFALLLHNPYN